MRQQRAKIVREVEIIFGEVQAMADAPNNVPLMQMEDTRVVPAYDCDRFIREGTLGWATLDMERRVWTFTPDPEPEIDTDDILPPPE